MSGDRGQRGTGGREGARLSLLGLSVGDAFGETFLSAPSDVERRLSRREMPPGPWPVTDDTIMAISIVEGLEDCGRIDQDRLVEAFVRRFHSSRWRGYGLFAATLLDECGKGGAWRELSAAGFDGCGSMGNGGAMRAAPIGGWFAGDPEAAAHEARLSAAVTHAHPDAQSGAAAVAAAAAWVAGGSGAPGLLSVAREACKDGPTRAGIERAIALVPATSSPDAARSLGSGYRMLSEDTVPFALWCAQRHLDDYRQALWSTAEGGGDVDTTCAIVGGIVALALSAEDIPAEWRAAREGLHGFGFREGDGD